MQPEKDNDHLRSEIDSARAQLLEYENKIKRLEEWCFQLAAGTCVEVNGLIGDEFGNQYCSVRKKLESEVDVLKKGIREFLIPWGPHLPESWREHFENLVGPIYCGLRDNLE